MIDPIKKIYADGCRRQLQALPSDARVRRAFEILDPLDAQQVDRSGRARPAGHDPVAHDGFDGAPQIGTQRFGFDGRQRLHEVARRQRLPVAERGDDGAGRYVRGVLFRGNGRRGHRVHFGVCQVVHSLRVLAVPYTTGGRK